jgi:hypothetical protein
MRVSRCIRGWPSRACVGVLVAGMAACKDVQPPRMAITAQVASEHDGAGALDGVIRWGRDIRLEENDDVVNVLVRMNLDPRGGFVVADEEENQIRHYDPQGRLRGHKGRKGGGPGEFEYLHRALPLRSGGFLGFDTFYRGALFDSAGGVTRTFQTPVGPLHDARLVDDTLVLLAGDVPRRGPTAPRPRLHLWNVQRGRLVRSFFVPPVHGRAHVLAANTAGFMATDVRHDTIAAAFALTDTVYFFGLDGRPLRKVPIPFRHFRRLSEGGRLPGPNSGVVAAREWLASFSLISHLFWLRDGTLLVQYQDRMGAEPHWRLLRMTADGAPLFEIVGTPYLLEVDRRTDELYFQKPGSPTPDVWTLATLRH